MHAMIAKYLLHEKSVKCSIVILQFIPPAYLKQNIIKFKIASSSENIVALSICFRSFRSSPRKVLTLGGGRGGSDVNK